MMKLTTWFLLASVVVVGCAAAPDDAGARSLTAEIDADPDVVAAVDRPEVDTSLGRSEAVVLTLTSTGSFSGNVSVSPSLVDGLGVPLTTGGLTVTGPTFVTVPAGGSASATYTVAIPTTATATGMSATLLLQITSPSGGTSSSALVVVAPNYVAEYAAGLGNNVFMHPMTLKNFSLKRGAKIVLPNNDAVLHITGGSGAFSNEGPTGGQPGNTYTIDTSQLVAGSTGRIGCKSHNTPTYGTVTIVD